MIKCPICSGSGESTGNGMLDCPAPDCTAATDRATLNDSIAALGPMTRDDIAWAAYRAGVAVSEERHAREVAELAAMVRKMWGWAVELGQDDCAAYWIPADDDRGTSKADWQSDMLAGAALAKKYGK